MATTDPSHFMGARVLTSGTTAALDAIELLKGDHRQVESWFDDYARAESAPRRAELIVRLCQALRVHMQIEEEIFYPAFLEAVGDEPLHDAAEEAHAEAKELIAAIEAGNVADDTGFELQVNALQRLIERHVTDEEQTGGLFDEVGDSDLDRAELGARLERRKLELMDDATTDAGYDAAVKAQSTD